MRLAIMQPYFFPYIGYFQLIGSVDKFVLLDDVNFINQGWINRNRILINNSDFVFTVPINKVSQNILIKETFIIKDNKWKSKFLRTLELAYKKAPSFDEAFPVISGIIHFNELNLSSYIYNSLTILSAYLGIETSIVPTSTAYNNAHLKAQDKIIDICLQEKAEHYINPIGGMELYSKSEFKRRNIYLSFIKSIPISYNQFGKEFIPWLSIIDVMMFNSREAISDFLKQYSLVENE